MEVFKTSESLVGEMAEWFVNTFSKLKSFKLELELQIEKLYSPLSELVMQMPLELINISNNNSYSSEVYLGPYLKYTVQLFCEKS